MQKTTVGATARGCPFSDGTTRQGTAQLRQARRRRPGRVGLAPPLRPDAATVGQAPPYEFFAFVTRSFRVSDSHLLRCTGAETQASIESIIN